MLILPCTNDWVFHRQVYSKACSYMKCPALFGQVLVHAAPVAELFAAQFCVRGDVKRRVSREEIRWCDMDLKYLYRPMWWIQLASSERRWRWWRLT